MTFEELLAKYRAALMSAQRQAWFFAGNDAKEYDLESLTNVARDWYDEWTGEIKELDSE